MRDGLRVQIWDQTLHLYREGEQLAQYLISSATRGVGEAHGSEQTPRGQHIIRAKIGAGAVLGSVFVARRLTGEIYSERLAQHYPDRDWILTRILWLSGREFGKNRMGQRDSMRRYIYIHGCPDRCVMGQPGSHGCIRMRNQDIIELFDHTWVGMPVAIQEFA